MLKVQLVPLVSRVFLLALLASGCGFMEEPDPVVSDAEVAALEQRFLRHEFPTVYSDRRAVDEQVRGFRGPGAGMSVIGKLTNSQSQSYCVYEVSVPGRGRDLVMVFQYDSPTAESCHFVHRFIIDCAVEDELLEPRREVKIEDGCIRYYFDGREYKSMELPPKA